ncbi:nucleotidyltransferase family protein [Pseudoflavonifractor phocaeensis]|uniref:nucleotidyltransferase family protein n=1 Tax=Pseudoflavonifractor phocaeensis TaxID=1870988 RepID=UPI00210A2966|nr:nucleotidyltransferase domain-containing protein [Pseudoflavonifractor phocaeensis]MCQ4863528.1 nucleotidyltransferase domain-containing protein [Pseudoflavonifractor phocaeensis]
MGILTGEGRCSALIYTIDDLKKIILPIARKYQLKAVYLFGSYARNTATEHSDIDLLVDTTGTSLKSLVSLGALYCELEEALGKRVDLVTVSALEQRAQLPSEADFRETILNEKVDLYAVA